MSFVCVLEKSREKHRKQATQSHIAYSKEKFIYCHVLYFNLWFPLCIPMPCCLEDTMEVHVCHNNTIIITTETMGLPFHAITAVFHRWW